MLEKAYAKIGGLAGSGFSSKEDVITKIPFWKLYTRNDQLLMAGFYKDSNGRKAVAFATDGTSAAKKILIKTFKADVSVAYGEFSKAMLVTVMKASRFEDIKPFFFTPDQVAKILGKRIHPLTPELVATLDSSDQKIYSRYSPQLGAYFYAREIGGNLHLKVAFGTPEIPIT